jgi:cytochrome c oxidase assembly protein subunit 15
MKDSKKFSRFAFALLVYTLIVILWGAWVRISHSGDGCGSSWPLCNGQVIPQVPHAKTWVEFSHRITSGLFGLFVIALVWWGIKISSRTDPVRKALYASLFFMITEALLGAKLVLSGLVGKDDSVYRLSVMSLHQLNSLLLTGSVAMIVLLSIGTFERRSSSESISDRSTSARWLLFLLFSFIAIAITGGFAALSTTLFPSSSLLAGITQDFQENAHYLLRLRVSHPILGSLVGGSLALYFWLKSQQQQEASLQRASQQVALCLAAGVVFGFLTLLSLAPIWMKIVHLLLAHLMWIVLLRWAFFRRFRPSAHSIQSSDARI